MAGRPAAPTVIVNPIVVQPMNIRNELHNFTTLLPELMTPLSCLQWLASRRLIRNSLTCVGCQQLAKFTVHGCSIDGYRWVCQRCNMRKSVRDASFFSHSHLSLRQVIILVYCWAQDMPQNLMAHEADVGNMGTIVDWSNFMREECQVWLTGNNETIGGMDAQGDALVVEIDESNYFHRKYHRGQWRINGATAIGFSVALRDYKETAS